MKKDKDEFLTTAEVADALRINVATVTRLIRGGELKGLMFAAHWRVRRRDLDEFIAKKEREWEAGKAKPEQEERLAEIERNRAEQMARKAELKEARKRKPSPIKREEDLQLEALRAAMISALKDGAKTSRELHEACLLRQARLCFDGQTMRVGVDTKGKTSDAARNINLLRRDDARLLAALFNAGVDNPRAIVGSASALDMGAGLFLAEMNKKKEEKPDFYQLEAYIKGGFTLYARAAPAAGAKHANAVYKNWRTGSTTFCNAEAAAVRSQDELKEALRCGVRAFSFFPGEEGLVCIYASKEGARNLRNFLKRKGIPALDLYLGSMLVYSPDGAALFFFKDDRGVLRYRDAIAAGVKICGRAATRSVVASGSYWGGLWEGFVSKPLVAELPGSLKEVAAALTEPAAADRSF